MMTLKGLIVIAEMKNKTHKWVRGEPWKMAKVWKMRIYFRVKASKGRLLQRTKKTENSTKKKKEVKLIAPTY